MGQGGEGEEGEGRDGYIRDDPWVLKEEGGVGELEEVAGL